jgi:hypothetical protein
MKDADVRERDIERYLTQRVAEQGGATRKVQWIGTTGAPDRRVWFKTGFACWVELKAPSGKLSPRQINEHKFLRQWGEFVFVLSSLSDVDTFVENYSNMPVRRGTA